MFADPDEEEQLFQGLDLVVIVVASFTSVI